MLRAFRNSAAATFLLICASPASLAAEPIQIPAPKHAEHRIAIHCSLRILQLWRDAELVAEYPIEIGKGGVPKEKSGDHRTPLGDYEISWMASRLGGKGHKIIELRSWCKDNQFVNASSGPPLEKLWTDPYGGDQATVMSINYPNAKDKAMGFTGSCIHLHADRRIENGGLRKSYGCIHMFPPDAMELYQAVDVGVPVKILP
jgi:L,D-peptidoglycan transpeptidase YkuD (ErfK/YbiS/YcfS/YnhG family)